MPQTAKHQYIVKKNITLSNRLNNETVTGDLVNEDEIDGKKFFVMRVGPRTMKLAKDAYMIKKVSVTR